MQYGKEKPPVFRIEILLLKLQKFETDVTFRYKNNKQCSDGDFFSLALGKFQLGENKIKFIPTF